MENKTIHITETEPDGTVLLKYIRGEASDAEKAWVDGWLLEGEENEKTLEQVARIYYAARTGERIVSRDSQRAYNNVRKRLEVNNRKIWLRRLSVAAACFLGILVMSSVISYMRVSADRIKEVQIVTVQANAGMRTHFSLPDGTIAYLNSGSTISYPVPYDKKERRIKLEGEAFFKVTHNPDQPFIVSVKDDKMRVKVLGTEFNLQAYKEDDDVQTTLVTGSVDVEIMKSGNISSVSKLKPSEKAVYQISSGTVFVSTVNTVYETAWKDGRLMFKDLPLPLVLKKLSYFYNVKFDIEDSAINNYNFTGTFENKQLSQVLDYLKITSQLDYVIRYVATDDSLGAQYTTVILKKRK